MSTPENQEHTMDMAACRLSNSLVDRNRAGESRAEMVAKLSDEAIARVIEWCRDAMSMDYIQLAITCEDEQFNRKGI